ncbi:MAG TPA: TPM domain-containing protein [Allosphingosinicella sp.]
MRPDRLVALLLALLILAVSPAIAQTLPPLTGRVVDQAELLGPEQEAQLIAKLEALQRSTTRQLVVVTVPDLQGHPVEDFAFRLGEQWKIGDREADNGAILLVAVADRRVRIEVGDGIEGILPDAMSWFIIRDRITPRFKEQDYAGGILAGVDGIIEQLQAPLEVAEQRALQATARRRELQQQRGNGGGSIVPFIFWGVILFFIIVPAMFGRGGRGRRYRRGGSGLGHIVLWSALDAATRGGGGSGWGGGGGGWGGGGGGFSGGGGGFSGGGGSFGGGGASGSW